MTATQQILLGSGGGSKATFVDDVFSTYLWRGNGSNSATRTMSNGVDLAGEGGMVWIKNRTTNNTEAKIVDTVRGLTGSSPYYVIPSESTAQGDRNWNWSFLNNGFSFNQDYGDINGNNEDYASWTFRKAEGFFTCLTYTGNATNRGILHDLGSQPGMMIIKKTSGSDPWHVWHKGLSNNTKTLSLDSSGGESGNASVFNSTAPTATQFYLGTSGHSNENNQQYICYLFADDAQLFGEDSDKSIIKCGGG
jgi:hypothetical protein